MSKLQFEKEMIHPVELNKTASEKLSTQEGRVTKSSNQVLKVKHKQMLLNTCARHLHTDCNTKKKLELLMMRGVWRQSIGLHKKGVGECFC